jgi:hypothetical protein
LARELGVENKDVLDLCDELRIGVGSHSSSIEEPQADRVRRLARDKGLGGSGEEDERSRRRRRRREAREGENSEEETQAPSSESDEAGERKVVRAGGSSLRVRSGGEGRTLRVRAAGTRDEPVAETITSPAPSPAVTDTADVSEPLVSPVAEREDIAIDRDSDGREAPIGASAPAVAETVSPAQPAPAVEQPAVADPAPVAAHVPASAVDEPAADVAGPATASSETPRAADPTSAPLQDRQANPASAQLFRQANSAATGTQARCTATAVASGRCPGTSGNRCARARAPRRCSRWWGRRFHAPRSSAQRSRWRSSARGRWSRRPRWCRSWSARGPATAAKEA